MTDAAELKLNIGCGTSGIEGWVNIDNSPSILLSRLPLGNRIFRTPDWPRDVRRVDVRKRIPYPDASVARIYSSHTGFPTPEVSAFGSSRIADIAEIELESRRSESLYVEAAK
jgi:hypothetical protein